MVYRITKQINLTNAIVVLNDFAKQLKLPVGMNGWVTQTNQFEDRGNYD